MSLPLNPADDAFAARLHDMLGHDTVRPADQAHLVEPRGRYHGQSGLLALPRSTDDVAAIVGLANEARVPVIPFGGGTGLVGGQVTPAPPAPLILSLARMNKVRSIFPGENVIMAEAGTILADLQAAAEAEDRLFPLSLAAEGTAQIGGNLATNAGGLNVLRYGNTRDLCLGLEAVLPDGRIWNGLSRLRKDNTGYDLRHLLIGSEGTLGVITAGAFRLFPRPRDNCTAFLVVPSPKAALDLLSLARDLLGETVSAFELIHRQGFDFLSETMPDVAHPFGPPPEWSVLIELGATAGAQDGMETLFSDALARDLVSDGLIAQSGQQRDAFWAVRESLPEANRRIGSVSSHDISLPLSAIPEFIAKVPPQLERIGDFRINCFGHLGDGNLHYNIFPRPGRSRSDHEAERDAIKRCIHDLVDQLDGSMSAEHGIGRLKVDDLERYGDPTKLSAMHAIKAALDPNGIMNPGAILRRAE